VREETPIEMMAEQTIERNRSSLKGVVSGNKQRFLLCDNLSLPRFFSSSKIA
jgi:hypothetical protein